MRTMSRFVHHGNQDETSTPFRLGFTSFNRSQCTTLHHLHLKFGPRVRNRRGASPWREGLYEEGPIDTPTSGVEKVQKRLNLGRGIPFRLRLVG